MHDDGQWMMGNNGGNTRERTLKLWASMPRFCWKFQLHFNGISKFPVDAIRRSEPHCLARAVRQQLYKQYAGLAFVFIYSFFIALLYLGISQ